MPGWPQSGDKIGPYVVHGLLGTTGQGQGQVYLADHAQQRRRVALAVLRPEDLNNASAKKRFFAEATALARIRHENLVQVDDVLFDPPWPCFAVEVLRGHALAEVQRKERKLPLARALHVAWQASSGLMAAHAGGLLHKALRPQSIFLVDRAGVRDVVKLVDFACSAPLPPGSTGTSPAYIAPEQFAGDSGDARTDVYSFGVILFELATGRLPWTATSVSELSRCHLIEDPPKPSTFAELPAALETVILRCLEKEPDHRPQSMADVQDWLRDVAPLVDSFQPGVAREDPTGDFALPGAAGWLVVPGQQTRPAPIDDLLASLPPLPATPVSTSTTSAPRAPAPASPSAPTAPTPRAPVPVPGPSSSPTPSAAPAPPRAPPVGLAPLRPPPKLSDAAPPANDASSMVRAALPAPSWASQPTVVHPSPSTAAIIPSSTLPTLTPLSPSSPLAKVPAATAVPVTLASSRPSSTPAQAPTPATTTTQGPRPPWAGADDDENDIEDVSDEAMPYEEADDDATLAGAAVDAPLSWPAPEPLAPVALPPERSLLGVHDDEPLLITGRALDPDVTMNDEDQSVDQALLPALAIGVPQEEEPHRYRDELVPKHPSRAPLVAAGLGALVIVGAVAMALWPGDSLDAPGDRATPPAATVAAAPALDEKPTPAAAVGDGMAPAEGAALVDAPAADASAALAPPDIAPPPVLAATTPPSDDLAPPPVVAASAPPPVPAEVALTFGSTPPGAAVLLGDVVLGETPFTAQLAPSPGAKKFVFTLDGHSQVTIKSAIEDGAVVAATMKPVKPAKPKVASRAPPKPRAKPSAPAESTPEEKGLREGALVNPFAKKKK